MDDKIPAIIHDYSAENDMGGMQDDAHLRNDPNVTMDVNRSYYTVIDNEDDEYNDNGQQNKQEPNVVTWFTFYSHREQREYYYEPISGTTTWIAPSQTVYDTGEVEHDNGIDGKETQSSVSSSNAVITNIISRLPGSPILRESIQHHVNHAITVSNQIHQNHIIPIITKRPVAILLLLCNIGLFYVLLRSGRNATTTNILSITTNATTNSIPPMSEHGTDHEIDKSSLLLSSKPMQELLIHETYQDDEKADSASNTVFENVYIDSDDVDYTAPTDPTKVHRTDEIILNDLYFDIIRNEEVEANGSEVNLSFDVTDERIDLITGGLPLLSQSTSDPYEVSGKVKHEESNKVSDDAPATEASRDHMATDTNEQSKAVDAGTDREYIRTDTKEKIKAVDAGIDREYIRTASIVSEPAKKIEMPYMMEPNIVISTEAANVGTLTIHEEVSTVATTLDEHIDAADAFESNAEEAVIDHEVKSTVAISHHELDRYETIQKEAMMVVQRVGMNAISAGYMIELEPNITTVASNISGSSAVFADFNTNNITGV